MSSNYNEVIARTLLATERNMVVNDNSTPLVIEPKGDSNAKYLCDFLQNNSQPLLKDLAKHGAILIRGFDIDTSAQFEQALLSIRGMSGMNELLLSEAGRTIADDTKFVFHTNALTKTGGRVTFDDFHSENYFSPDVPRFISFFCKQPSRFGGETGLVNLEKIYADLPSELKSKLEEKSCFAARYSLDEMAARYGLSVERLEAFCEKVGLCIDTQNDQRYVAVHKPSVISHPVKDNKVLLINFMNFPELQQAVMKVFLPDYKGIKWFYHKLNWHVPLLNSVIHPDGYLQTLYRRLRYGNSVHNGSNGSLESEKSKGVSTHFTSEDMKILAKSMRAHYSSFIWEKGDILIVDNMQMAHAGMPGYGSRDIKVMMCNPLKLPLTERGAGYYPVQEPSPNAQTLGSQILAFDAEYS
ncbi:hypothetical protein PSECIP111951_02066 [Pseudoalteromonas holothuriae]|uniref:TauD/TfdA-like domain-containing protein n=1 Tax=Pseudoalteromonas holothuriae TaxID=2963714 RepID=A0ABM9GIM4_9GAMM|nr:TauD/TfdA family dioxygenase [Pseudoalteromonas sp. CIP111951]CAH9059401.1 hypothetical protein PSECIP111951_02066 [Pseudoalteromonas sp. CIP111951]